MGEMFLKFFEIFGDEKFGHEGVEISDGLAAPGGGTLIMRCPLTGKDVNVISPTSWKFLHSEYTRARDMLRNNSSIETIIS